MLTHSNLLNSRYFPATIWFNILAGIIEKQGPMTNGCFKIGLLAMLEIVEPSLDGTMTGTNTPTVVGRHCQDQLPSAGEKM